MAIVHDNIIYISNISKLGGVESFAFYMVKKYKDLDIAVVCKSGDYVQLERIRKFCPAYIHRGEDIICKVIIINYDTSILDFVKQGDCYMVVHADYSQSCYTIYPKWNDPRIKKVLAITKYIQKMLKDKFNVDSELCYNPLILDKPQKRITLVSATRLSRIKGGERMKALAYALDNSGIDYVWYVFTNDNDCINSPNVIFLKPRLDVIKWIAEADALVQLSDTEACSYSINEALSYGKAVVVTPLPYLNELPVANEKIFILDFNLQNIKDVVEKIKSLKSQNKRNATNYGYILSDNYKNILAEGKSKYLSKEWKERMKKIKVKAKFTDMKHDNILRTIGEEFIEEDARAEELISRGYATLVEVIKPKEVKIEKAVADKEEEKATPTKAQAKAPTKKKAIFGKGNAKK